MKSKTTVWSPKGLTKKGVLSLVEEYGIDNSSAEGEASPENPVPWEVIITVKKPRIPTELSRKLKAMTLDDWDDWYNRDGNAGGGLEAMNAWVVKRLNEQIEKSQMEVAE